jgi:hypothetical protein
MDQVKEMNGSKYHTPSQIFIKYLLIKPFDYYSILRQIHIMIQFAASKRKITFPLERPMDRRCMTKVVLVLIIKDISINSVQNANFRNLKPGDTISYYWVKGGQNLIPYVTFPVSLASKLPFSRVLPINHSE